MQIETTVVDLIFKTFFFLLIKFSWRISSGLDPAGPLFHLTDPQGKIYRTDAEVVDVIHTNGGFLGELTPLGTVDFFVDGGRSQHTCTNDFFGQSASLSWRVCRPHSSEPRHGTVTSLRPN